MGVAHKIWRALPFSKHTERKRLNVIDRISGGILYSGKPAKILDVGCGNGFDFMRFLADRPELELHGVDVVDQKITQPNFTFHLVDAEKLPFEDKSFDLVVSIGVLEHIAPVEKLAACIREIDRVAKNYCIIMPAITTPLEPHMASIFWQLRGAKPSKKYPNFPINYYSDESWLSFQGFQTGKAKRFWYIPLVIRNICIYRNG